MLHVTKAKYLDGYRIHVAFSNGEQGVVDLEDALWGPAFEPLQDLEAFKRFHVSETFRTVCWDNGADFAPEFLYDKMMKHAMGTEAGRRDA